MPISTISFGTPYGFVEINDQRQPVPVDDSTMRKVAELSGGNWYSASNLQELKDVYASLQQQIGYETIKGDASVGWLRLGALVLALAALAALLINRRCRPKPPLFREPNLAANLAGDFRSVVGLAKRAPRLPGG